MNRLTLGEFGTIIDLAQERKREDYELMALAVQVGYINANSKKKITMFKKAENKQSGQRSHKITQEEKASELDYLDSLFN